jgi:hypothetical protein
MESVWPPAKYVQIPINFGVRFSLHGEGILSEILARCQTANREDGQA